MFLGLGLRLGFFFVERLGHDSPLEDSIEMLCLPLGCSNPGKGCRRNQSE